MKQFVCALMCLMGILGMKSAHAQCMDSVPWGTPLTFNSSCCWTGTPDNIWYQNNIYGQIYDLGDTTSDHRILSPWVQIPVSAAHDSLMLMYVASSVCHEDYSVCVTTDGVHFDTLFRGWTPSTEDYDYDTLYMGAYAGQWVRIEICHYVLNSTYVPDSACLSENMFGEILFELIKLESTVLPVATISMPERAYVGEGVQWMASLTRGSHTGLSYTWHSTLMGQTLTGDSVTMTYTAAGVDTVMMVASNAYGNDTVVNIIQVFDCPGVITAHPWLVNFETDYDCWRSIAAGRWIMSGNSVTAYGDGDKIFTSPALMMPTDSTGLRLYWKAKNNRYSGYVTYQVLVTTTDRFDIGSYDTLFSASQGTTQAQRSVSLADYAGDTVYIAFRQKDQSNSYIQISDVKMYNSVAPMGTLEAPTYSAAIGDTVRYTLHLTQGDNVSYSWHSALLDSTIVTLDSVLSIVYPFPGSETLTVTVSNAHGALSLETSLGVFDCDTISTFPWIEDFVETGSDAGYSACWNISGYSHLADNQSYSYSEEDGSPSTGSSRHDFMKSTTYGGFMFTPLIAVPAVIEKNLSLWVEHFYSLKVVIETESGTFDNVYSLNTRETIMRRRPISLEPYAGQTIRVRLINNTYSNNPMSIVDRIRIDYDTMPVIVLSGQQKTTTDSATLFVATQLRGFVPGLTYTWHSQVGGTFVTNATGDSAWVTYSAGITRSEDTVSVVATNAYGSGSAQRAIYVRDCSPQTTLPWRETFADGTVCWYKPEGSKFYDAIPYGNSAYERLRHLYLNTQKDTLGSWIMSKAIEIPADTNFGATLFWKVASSDNYYHHLYSVLATTADDYTDTANYTVLYTDSSTHINFSNYDTRSVSLAQYAGQTVHVAIHNHGNHNVPGGIGLYFDDIEVRTTQVPIVGVTADASTYYYGDTARFTATLQEGSTNGITYTWHSTMLDSTVTINSNLFTLNYTQSGVDTVTVIATNAYGSDTASVIVNSTIITQPQVTLQHTDANVGEPTVFTAVLNRCVTEGLTYTWHSTLLDTTITLNYNLLSINYPSTGVDTVSVIATNIYGSDTAVAVVSVQNCAPRVLPYYENFEGIVSTDAATAGSLPDCWNYYWNGSNAGYAPHVITTGGYQYMNDIPDNALFFVAGSSTGYGSTSIVYLPRFADSLQHLALALDYRFENSNRGTLTVGWFDSNEVFHTVRNLNGHQGSYVRDTIFFAGHRTADYRIALWWEYGSSWYAAVVDNIEVFVDNSIPAPANLTVDSIGATYARVTWDDVENATAYQVLIPGVLDTMVASQPLTLSNLTVATAYTVRVAAIVDGDTGRYASTSFTTLCHITQLPYNNDFSANSSINCWYTDHTYVSYQVLMADASSWENRYFATQPIEAPGNDLSVSFSMRVGSADTGYIVGGVMPIDGSAFIPIDTFRFANDWQSFSFSTVSAPDGWLRVAFCIPGQTSSNGLSLVLQMDDLLIDRIPSCPMPRGVRATFDDAYTAHLEWQYGHSHSSPTTTLITLTDATSGTTSLLTVQGTDTTIVADAPYHRYHAELRTLCGADTTEAVAIDFEPAPCTVPEATVVVDTHSVTLSWARLGSENLWQVSYRPAGSSVWTFVDSLDVTTYTIGNLQQATDYELRVGSLCAQGDILYGSIITATTLCGRFGLPYSYDFTTGKEGCWQVPNYLSASTSYSTGGARMDDYMAQPRPIVSPEIDHSLAGTVVRYSVHADRFYSSVVKAGVCDEGGANIMWLDTIVAADGLNDYILRLDTFTGEQRHLCFYGEFITLLCDVLVDSVAGCLPVTDLRLSHLSNVAATVSWTASDGAAAYAVWLDGVLQGTTTGTTYTFAGLNSKTHYVAAVSPISVAADTGVAVRKHFTTLCPPRILPYSMNFENEYRLDSICWHTILYPYADHPTAGIYGTSQRELFLGAVASASSYDTRYRNFVCSPLLASEGQDVSVSFRAALYSFNAESFLEVGIMPDPADTAGFVAIGNVTPTSGGNTYIDHQFTIPAAALPQPFCLAFRFGGTLVRCYIDDVSITGATAAIDDADLPVCRLYPNPATGSVTIESDKTCEVSLYDAMGRNVMLLRLTAGINNIDVSALATGVYYLKPSDRKLIIKR